MRRPGTWLKNIESEIDFLTQVHPPPHRDRLVGPDATEPDIAVFSLNKFDVGQHDQAAQRRRY